jgi:hypothetical protein
VLALVPTMAGAVERQKRRRTVKVAVAASLFAVSVSLVVAWRLGLVGL